MNEQNLLNIWVDAAKTFKTESRECFSFFLFSPFSTCHLKNVLNVLQAQAL